MKKYEQQPAPQEGMQVVTAMPAVAGQAILHDPGAGGSSMMMGPGGQPIHINVQVNQPKKKRSFTQRWRGIDPETGMYQNKQEVVDEINREAQSAEEVGVGARHHRWLATFSTGTVITLIGVILIVIGAIPEEPNCSEKLLMWCGINLVVLGLMVAFLWHLIWCSNSFLGYDEAKYKCKYESCCGVTMLLSIPFIMMVVIYEIDWCD